MIPNFIVIKNIILRFKRNLALLIFNKIISKDGFYYFKIKSSKKIKIYSFSINQLHKYSFLFLLNSSKQILNANLIYSFK